MTGILESALRQLLKNVVHEVAADFMEEWKASARQHSPHSTPANDSFLLTARETAKRLAISERHLHKLTRSGQLPCIRVGKCLRYNTETIQKWVRDAESTESPNINNDTSIQTSGASERKPSTRSQLQPKVTARRNSAKKKAFLQEGEPPKKRRPSSNGRPKEVQSEERISPLSVLLSELGIDRSSLPPITNGELMRIAEVDIATMHGWQYLNRSLPEEAMGRLKKHFRHLVTERQSGE